MSFLSGDRASSGFLQIVEVWTSLRATDMITASNLYGSILWHLCVYNDLATRSEDEGMNPDVHKLYNVMRLQSDGRMTFMNHDIIRLL